MCLGSLLLRFLHVGLDEELTEKEEERQNVHNVGKDDPKTCVLALSGHKVSSLTHHSDELDQLHHGKGRLPPDGKRLAGFRILGVHADKVISVHDSVDESVKNNGEVDITIVVNMRIEPVEEENSEMMVNVKEGKLSPLLSEHNEDGVPEIPDLGSIKHPQQVGNGRVLRVERIARHQSVIITVSQKEGFDGHVSTKHDLRNVVDEFERIRIHGRNSSFHDGATNENKCQISQGNREGGTEIREQPSLSMSPEFILGICP